MKRVDDRLQRTRRAATLFVASLCVVLAPYAKVYAQSEPTGRFFGPTMCYYGPGQYVPCGSAPPPQGPDPFQWSRARFESLGARLRSYGVGTAGEKPLPQTLEELSREAGEQFVSAAYKLDRLNFDSNELAQKTRRAEAELQTLAARESTLKSRAAQMPAELHKASDALTRELAQAEAYERVVSNMEAGTDRLRARADRAALESFMWLSVASPKGALLLNEQMVLERKRAEREPLREPRDFIELRPKFQSLPGTGPIATRPPGPRPAPSGTADEKMEATETLLGQLDSATTEYGRRQRRYEAATLAVAKASTRVKSLEAFVGSEQERLSAVEEMKRKASSRTFDGLFNLPRVGPNAANALAEAFILEKFRDEVVIPEVKRFLRANGITQEIDFSLIKQLYEMRKSILYKRVDESSLAFKRLLKTEKRVLEIIPDFMKYATETADLLSNPEDSKRGAELSREMDINWGVTERDLFMKATGTPGLLSKISRAIWKTP